MMRHANRRDRDQGKGMSNVRVFLALLIGVSCGFLAAFRSNYDFAGVTTYSSGDRPTTLDEQDALIVQGSSPPALEIPEDNPTEAALKVLSAEHDATLAHLTEVEKELKKLKSEHNAMLSASKECSFILDQCKHEKEHALKQQRLVEAEWHKQLTERQQEEMNKVNGQAGQLVCPPARASEECECGGGGAGALVPALALPGGQGDGSPAVLQPDTERDKHNPILAEQLRNLAINNEVLVAISDGKLARKGQMLDTWAQEVKRAGVTNYMVVALDDVCATFCEKHGIPYYRKRVVVPAAQQGVGSNHAISGLKFIILQDFLLLGYSVLLSDVDIVTLQNPFDHLYRDSDIEGMSDGWDTSKAYGYDDVDDDESMGWARYAHSMRVFCINSGLFFARPTRPTLALMERVRHRLDTEKAWDQQVFNEVIFFPSHGNYTDPLVSRRIMDIYKFVNSKTLFKTMRKSSKYDDQLPVTVHVNYHPDKHQRMLKIVDRYVHGIRKALDSLPDGSQHVATRGGVTGTFRSGRTST